MAVFEIIQEDAPKPVKRKSNQWVALGVEFSKAKAKGITSKEFAKSKGIAYSTFTKSMSRYAKEIKAGIELDAIKGKSAKGLNKHQRALRMINDFRANMRAMQGPRAKNKSEEWFAKTIRTGIKSHQVVKPTIGKLYTFAYDAKYKDTLPFWDKFPLIIYLGDGTSKAGNHLFYGLNLHYIPPTARQSFLEALLKQHASTPSLSNKTRLKINWSDVKGMRGSDLMIKAYLPGHIKTKLVEIATKDWANVIYMPTYQFMSKGSKYDARKVWKHY